MEVPAGQQTAGINVIKQISGGEMAIMATPGFTDSMKVNVLKTNVEYIGNGITERHTKHVELILSSARHQKPPLENGTARPPTKYRTTAKPTDLRALSELEERRAACDILNTRFQKYLKEPIQVVWNEDNISRNYDYLNNLERLAGDDNAE